MTNAGYPIEVNGRRFVASLRGFTRRPLQSTRQLQDSSREPSDASFEPHGIFKRTQSDFSHGAGQAMLDNVEDRDRARFNYSRHLDPFTEPTGIKLLPKMTERALSTGVAGAVQGKMVAVSDWLYVICGTFSARIDTANTVTVISNPSGGSPFVDIFTFDQDLYATTENGKLWTMAAGGTTWTGVTLAPSAAVHYGATASGYIVLTGQNGKLYQYDGVTTITEIWAHPEPTAWYWSAAIGTPRGIYVFGKDGTTGSWAFRLNVDETTGKLSAPTMVMQIPKEERVTSVSYHSGGALLICTERGVRFALIDSNGYLQVGKLNDAPQFAYTSFAGADYIWFGGLIQGSHLGLGVVDPSVFVEEPFMPAWSYDRMIEPSNVNTHIVTAGHWFNGGVWMAVSDYYQSGTNVRLYRDSSDLAVNGIFNSGRITFGTPELKAPHSIEVEWENLIGEGAGVQVWAADSRNTLIGEGVFDPNNSGSYDVGRVPLVSTATPYITVGFRLYSSYDGNNSPILTRWTLRTVPLPFRVEEIIVPIIISDSVSYEFEGNVFEDAMDPIEAFTFFHDLMTSRKTVTLKIGDQAVDVRVDAIGVGPDVQDVGITGMTVGDQDWMNGTWAVRFLTMEPQE